MSSKLIPTTPGLASVVPIEEPQTAIHPGAAKSAWRFLKFLASLRLTVFLFSLSMVLVFFGTLALIDGGMWKIVDSYFRSYFVWVPFQLGVQFLQIFFGLDHKLTVGGAFPFPGGWTIGFALLANLLAAHLVRFKLTWKRSGILLIHAGLIVMMLGELLTGLFAIESRMTIDEGGAANYADETRRAELAFVTPSESDSDKVVVVPSAWLSAGSTIQDARLPCDIEVVRYMANSHLADASKDGDNMATKGAGLSTRAVEEAEVSGVAEKQTIETPSAYLRLKNKKTGEDLGTHLVSFWLKPQPVIIDDVAYELSLRFKRNYKDFTMHLLKFRFDRYPGTETPKNFSSLVRVNDPGTGEDREYLIKMNEPLLYKGETYYQADWDKKTEKTTVLQVVRNPAWWLPYVSCGMVTLGMLIHFCLNLVGFLGRRIPS